MRMVARGENLLRNALNRYPRKKNPRTEPEPRPATPESEGARDSASSAAVSPWPRRVPRLAGSAPAVCSARRPCAPAARGSARRSRRREKPAIAPVRGGKPHAMARLERAQKRAAAARTELPWSRRPRSAGFPRPGFPSEPANPRPRSTAGRAEPDRAWPRTRWTCCAAAGTGAAGPTNWPRCRRGSHPCRRSRGQRDRGQAYNTVESTAIVASVPSTWPSIRSRARSTILTSGTTESRPLNSSSGIRLIRPGAREKSIKGIK